MSGTELTDELLPRRLLLRCEVEGALEWASATSEESDDEFGR